MSGLLGEFSPSQINDHSSEPTIDRILVECGLSDRLKNLVKSICERLERSEPSSHLESAITTAGKERDELKQLKVFIAEYGYALDSPLLWSGPYDPNLMKYRRADLYLSDPTVREDESVRHYPTLYAQLIKENAFPDDPLGFFEIMKEKSVLSPDPLRDCMRLYDPDDPYGALFGRIKDLPDNIDEIEKIIWRQDPARNIKYLGLVPECLKASLEMHKRLLALNMIDDACEFEGRCRSRLIELDEYQDRQDYVCRMRFQRLSDPAARTANKLKLEWIALSYIYGPSFHDNSLSAGKKIEYIDECLIVADWEAHPVWDISYSGGRLTVARTGLDTKSYDNPDRCRIALEQCLPEGLVIRLLKSNYAKLAASRIPFFLKQKGKEAQVKAIQVLFRACCPEKFIENQWKFIEEPWFNSDWANEWCQILFSDDQWQAHYQKLDFILWYKVKTWLDKEWSNLYIHFIIQLGAVRGTLWNDYDALIDWIEWIKRMKPIFPSLGLSYSDLIKQADRALFLLRRELTNEDAVKQIKKSEPAYSILLTHAPGTLLLNLFMGFLKSDVPCSGQGLEFGAGDSLVNAELHKNPAHWWLSIMISNCLRLEYAWNELLNEPGRADSVPDGYVSDVTMKLRIVFAEFCWKSLRLKKGEKCESGQYSGDQCTEPNALWREAFVHSLAEIGLDLGGKVHKTLFFIRENDPVESVREAAKQAYKAVRRQHHHNEDEPVKGLLIAFWVLRLAQRKALGEKIDQNEATRSRRNELRYADQVREVYRLLIK